MNFKRLCKGLTAALCLGLCVTVTAPTFAAQSDTLKTLNRVKHASAMMYIAEGQTQTITGNRFTSMQEAIEADVFEEVINKEPTEDITKVKTKGDELIDTVKEKSNYLTAEYGDKFVTGNPNIGAASEGELKEYNPESGLTEDEYNASMSALFNDVSVKGITNNTDYRKTEVTNVLLNKDDFNKVMEKFGAVAALNSNSIRDNILNVNTAKKDNGNTDFVPGETLFSVMDGPSTPVNFRKLIDIIIMYFSTEIFPVALFKTVVRFIVWLFEKKEIKKARNVFENYAQGEKDAANNGEYRLYLPNPSKFGITMAEALDILGTFISKDDKTVYDPRTHQNLNIFNNKINEDNITNFMYDQYSQIAKQIADGVDQINADYCPANLNIVRNSETVKRIKEIAERVYFGDNYGLPVNGSYAHFSLLRETNLKQIRENVVYQGKFYDDFLWKIYDSSGKEVGVYETDKPELLITAGKSDVYTIEQYQKCDVYLANTKTYQIRYYFYLPDTNTLIASWQETDTKIDPIDNSTSTRWVKVYDATYETFKGKSRGFSRNSDLWDTEQVR